MNKQTGYIENTSRDGKRIQVDGTWFSAFASSQLTGVGKGDYVTFTYTEKASSTGGDPFRNIKGSVSKATPPASSPVTAAGVAKSSGPAGSFVPKQFPVPALHPDRSIIRQNSLSHATDVVSMSYSTASAEDMALKVIEIARIFEAYSSGDLDAELVDAEVKKMLAVEVS